MKGITVIMNLTEEITELKCIVYSIYEREHERAYHTHRDVPQPEYVDAKFSEIKQIFNRVYKVVEANNERLVKEVNKDGN